MANVSSRDPASGLRVERKDSQHKAEGLKSEIGASRWTKEG